MAKGDRSMNYTEHEVELLAEDNTRILGTLVEPKRVDAFVLLLHGITVNRNEYGNFYQIVSRELAKAGIGSLRIDFRGHGASPVASSAFTISSQLADTKAAIDWIVSKYPEAKLYIWGTSFGGPPALHEASRTRGIAGVFLLAPVLDYVKTFLEPTTEWARQSFNSESLASARVTGKLMLDGTFELGLPILEEMRRYDPKIWLSNCPSQVVIVHGQEDSMVPFSISKAAAQLSPSIDLIGIPAMDHGFIASGDDDGSSAKSKENIGRIVNEFLAMTRK